MKVLQKFLFTILLFSCLLSMSRESYATEKINDKNITNAVDNELLFNATTPSYLIDVETIDGVVKLTGSVDNMLAKDRAVKIARTVKGVRAVIDQIEVNAPYRPDQLLENDINNALYNDPATDSYEIVVTANDGVVTLSGTVESWQEKQLSEYVTKEVRGVKAIRNNLVINNVLERPDYEIREDIVQGLKNDVRIDDGLIDVEVNKGQVKLSGMVGSASEKSIAYAKAWTSGVHSVNDKQLKVEEWARDKMLRKDKYLVKDDDALKRAVKDAFLYDPRVFSFNPDITVDEGVVTLTGVVDNLKAKRAAGQSAKNVVGVVRVKNYLKVRPVYIPENDELKAEIENAVHRKPSVGNWEVNVKANNGVVYLNGVVDSYFEKYEAEDIASKVKGVVAVENNLKVLDNNDYYVNNYFGWNTYFPPYHIDVKTNFKSDSEIKAEIVSELWWSPYVNEDQVTVTVSDGVATLKGTVDTRREKLYAEINALEAGAIKVENDLTVAYKP